MLKEECVGYTVQSSNYVAVAVRDAQIEPNVEESVGCIDQHVLYDGSMDCFWIRNYC